MWVNSEDQHIVLFLAPFRKTTLKSLIVLNHLKSIWPLMKIGKFVWSVLVLLQEHQQLIYCFLHFLYSWHDVPGCHVLKSFLNSFVLPQLLLMLIQATSVPYLSSPFYTALFVSVHHLVLLHSTISLYPPLSSSSGPLMSLNLVPAIQSGTPFSVLLFAFVKSPSLIFQCPTYLLLQKTVFLYNL